MTGDLLSQFAGEKYLSLETYKKSGEPVRTPVWFAEDSGVFYFYTLAESFKIKRIRNNPSVRVAPCDMRGNVKGEWVGATAHLLDEAKARHAHELLNRKYGLLKQVGNFLGRLRGHRYACVAIQFL